MPYPYVGIRGEAVQYIPSMIEEGLSNSQIVDFLKLNDLGYRNTLMFQDVNRLRLEQIGADQIKDLDAFDPVPDRLMRTWSGDTKYDYRVVVKYEYFDTNELTTREGYTTLYYDFNPSQENVLDDWAIRRQTIENTYGHVQEVFSEKQIHYYRNVR